jgi:hypothetical protein
MAPLYAVGKYAILDPGIDPHLVWDTSSGASFSLFGLKHLVIGQNVIGQVLVTYLCRHGEPGEDVVRCCRERATSYSTSLEEDSDYRGRSVQVLPYCIALHCNVSPVHIAC